MLDIIILCLLAIGFLIGFRRGFILQVIFLAGYIVSFVVAFLYYDDIAPHLKLWIPYPAVMEDGIFAIMLEAFQAEQAYYKIIAFALLFIGTKIVMHIIGSMLDFLADLPILHTINGWLGGFLGLIQIYLLLFVILYVGALTPIPAFQTHINNSLLAMLIINHTPGFSQSIKNIIW